MSEADDMVRRYLETLRRVSELGLSGEASADSITTELERTQRDASNTADVLRRVELVSRRRRLEAAARGLVEFKQYETDFETVGKEWSTERGIDVATWREFGVPADVLARAGIAKRSVGRPKVNRSETTLSAMTPDGTPVTSGKYVGKIAYQFSMSKECYRWIVAQRRDEPTQRAVTTRIILDGVALLGQRLPSDEAQRFVMVSRNQHSNPVRLAVDSEAVDRLNEYASTLEREHGAEPFSLAKRHAVALGIEANGWTP